MTNLNIGAQASNNNLVGLGGGFNGQDEYHNKQYLGLGGDLAAQNDYVTGLLLGTQKNELELAKPLTQAGSNSQTMTYGTTATTIIPA